MMAARFSSRAIVRLLEYDQIAGQRVVVNADRKAQRLAEGRLYGVRVIALQPGQRAGLEREHDHVYRNAPAAAENEQQYALILGDRRQRLAYIKALQMQESIQLDEVSAHGILG